MQTLLRRVLLVGVQGGFGRQGQGFESREMEVREDVVDDEDGADGEGELVDWAGAEPVQDLCDGDGRSWDLVVGSKEELLEAEEMEGIRFRFVCEALSKGCQWNAGDKARRTYLIKSSIQRVTGDHHLVPTYDHVGSVTEHGTAQSPRRDLRLPTRMQGADGVDLERVKPS